MVTKPTYALNDLIDPRTSECKSIICLNSSGMYNGAPITFYISSTKPVPVSSEGELSGTVVKTIYIADPSTSSDISINDVVGKYLYIHSEALNHWRIATGSFFGNHSHNSGTATQFGPYSHGGAENPSFVYFPASSTYEFHIGEIVENGTISSKGTTKYSNVTSTSSSTYPANGVSGSYWYVKIS